MLKNFKMKKNIKNLNVNQQETCLYYKQDASYCSFIAGFIEGEGSLWASLNLLRTNQNQNEP
jgi:hypothetical protein